MNKGGGAVQAQENLEAGSAACRDLGLPFHLDGARAWNALRTTGEDWTQYGRRFDSISCVSRRDSEPRWGIILLGSRAFIEEAHRSRKVMGGGMRQVAFWPRPDCMPSSTTSMVWKKTTVALPPSVSASRPTERSRLWLRWRPTSSLPLCLRAGPQEMVEHFASHGVLCSAFGPDKVRWVTHLDFGRRTWRVLAAVDTWS